MKVLILSLLTALLVGALQYETHEFSRKDGMLILDDETMDLAIASFDHLLVSFYADFE
jgi:hypothetical protein